MSWAAVVTTGVGLASSYLNKKKGGGAPPRPGEIPNPQRPGGVSTGYGGGYTDSYGNYNFWDKGSSLGGMMDQYRSRNLMDALMGGTGSGAGASAKRDLLAQIAEQEALVAKYKDPKANKQVTAEEFVDPKFLNPKTGKIWDDSTPEGHAALRQIFYAEVPSGKYAGKSMKNSMGFWLTDRMQEQTSKFKQYEQEAKSREGNNAISSEALGAAERRLAQLQGMQKDFDAEPTDSAANNPMLQALNRGGSRRSKKAAGGAGPEGGPGGGAGPMPLPGEGGGLHDPTWQGKELEVDPMYDPWATEMSKRAQSDLSASDEERAKARLGLDNLNTKDFWNSDIGMKLNQSLGPGGGNGGEKIRLGEYQDQYRGVGNALNQRAQNDFQNQGAAQRQSMASRGLAGSSLTEAGRIRQEAGLNDAKNNNLFQVAGLEAQGREAHAGRQMQAAGMNNQVDQFNANLGRQKAMDMWGIDQGAYNRGAQALDFRNQMANQLFGQGMTALNTRTALEQRGMDNAYRDASFADQRDQDNWNQRMQMLNFTQGQQDSAFNRSMAESGMNNQRVGMGMGYNQAAVGQQNQRDMAQYGMEEQSRQQQWQYEQMRQQEQDRQWAQLAGMAAGGIAGGFSGGQGWNWGNAGRGALGMGPAPAQGAPPPGAPPMSSQYGGVQGFMSGNTGPGAGPQMPNFGQYSYRAPGQTPSTMLVQPGSPYQGMSPYRQNFAPQPSFNPYG